MALNITARLGLDAKGFKAGAEQARQTAGKMKKHIGGEFKSVAAGMAGMFAAAYVGSQIRETVEYAAKVRDLANVFGMSTDQVQKLDYAATQSGISLEEVMDAHKDLGKSMSEALAGVEGKIWAFKALGISVDEIKGKNIDQVFMRVAKAISESGPILEPDQVKAIEDMMGGAGFKALNMMRGDLEAVFQNLENIGGIIDEQAIQKLGEMSDKMEEFKTQNRGVWADMVGFMSQTWMSFVNYLTASIDEIAEMLVNTVDAMKKMGAGFNVWRSGITNKDQRAMGKKMMADANAMLQQKSGVDIGERIVKRVEEKESKFAKRMEAKKAQDELNRKIQAAGELEKGRAKVADELAKLADEDEKRRFDALSTAQQLLHLEMKLAGERAKMAKLPALHTEEDMKAATVGLDGIKAAEKLASMEAENLARKKQEAVVEGELAGVAKKREESKKEQPASKYGLAGEAKFGALARIGGKLGGRNPVLDTAKKQLKVAEEIAIASLETAAAVGEIAGTK